MPEEESKLTKKLEEATKFTEEELKKIKEIQDEYYRTQNQFGQLSVSEIRLNEQLEGLEKLRDETTIAFKNIQEEERKFLDEITNLR